MKNTKLNIEINRTWHGTEQEVCQQSTWKENNVDWRMNLFRELWISRHTDDLKVYYYTPNVILKKSEHRREESRFLVYALNNRLKTGHDSIAHKRYNW